MERMVTVDVAAAPATTRRLLTLRQHAAHCQLRQSVVAVGGAAPPIIVDVLLTKRVTWALIHQTDAVAAAIVAVAVAVAVTVAVVVAVAEAEADSVTVARTRCQQHWPPYLEAMRAVVVLGRAEVTNLWPSCKPLKRV